MRSRAIVAALLAAGLVGVVLPAGPAQARAVNAAPSFGFSTTSTATPLKLEVYEPTIPIPASPQAELSLAYTKATSATGPSTAGRASWLWPGDSVGEGWKTFVDQLGLPSQLGDGGYRVQVNSSSPGGPGSQSDEPVPGTVMKTRSSQDRSVAEAGYSPDGDVSEQGQKSGGGAPGAPGVPSGPGSPGAPVPAPGGPSGHAGGRASAGNPTGPGLPPQLTALVDAAGVASISRSVTKGGTVVSSASSRVTGLSLLSGLITADSVRVVADSTSNGSKGVAGGSARVVGLALAGNQFTVDRNGVHAAGHQVPVPGLPADPAKALDKLGISFVLPHGRRSTQGADATTVLQGLQVVIDTRVLRSKLDGIPLDEIVNQVPDQAGPLKSVLGALVHLAPKLVITTGNAATDVSTVPGIALPNLAGLTGPATPGGSGVPGGVGAAGGAGAPAAGGAPPGGAANAGGTPTSTAATRNVAAGLPPLDTVPGALLVGGILLAAGLGWWLQRIGAFVIGGAGSCSHGLENGIPDLRKA